MKTFTLNRRKFIAGAVCAVTLPLLQFRKPEVKVGDTVRCIVKDYNGPNIGEEFKVTQVLGKFKYFNPEVEMKYSKSVTNICIDNGGAMIVPMDIFEVV